MGRYREQYYYNTLKGLTVSRSDKAVQCDYATFVRGLRGELAIEWYGTLEVLALVVKKMWEAGYADCQFARRESTDRARPNARWVKVATTQINQTLRTQQQRGPPKRPGEMFYHNLNAFDQWTRDYPPHPADEPLDDRHWLKCGECHGYPILIPPAPPEGTLCQLCGSRLE